MSFTALPLLENVDNPRFYGTFFLGGIVNPEKASLEELMEKCFHKYELKLNNLQLIFAEPGDDWQSTRHKSESAIKILHSVNLNFLLQNCLIRNHPKLPLGRIFGYVPTLRISITDQRLLALLRMLCTIPLPNFNYTGDMEFSEQARVIVR